MPKVKRKMWSLWTYVLHVLSGRYDDELVVAKYYELRKKAGKQWRIIQLSTPVAFVGGNKIVVYDEEYTKLFMDIADEYELYSGKDITVILDKPLPLDPEAIR